MQSETYRSLRSSLGVKLSAQFEAHETEAAIDATVVWNHEFLNRYGTARASFVPWRDTGTASVSLTGKFAEGFAASLGVGTEFGGDVSGVGGHLNLKWEF